MIPILMYHQVADIPRDLDPLGLAVPPVQFERQMRFLGHNGYRCLSLPQAVRYLREGADMPARSFVLTFDDGYQDLLTNASPILERLGFTATVFLVAGRIGAPSNWTGQDGARSGLLLSWAEARDLARREFTLGSHTISHRRLPQLDDQSANEEICNSRMLLQDRLEAPIDFFSYPYSDTNERIERLVESAGYTAACAGNIGSWSFFHLWRIPCVRDDTPLSFRWKVSGWYDRKIALRESPPGRLLRSGVRTLRRGLIRPFRHHPPASNKIPGREPEQGR